MPPAQMPLPAAEIVPELLMPPEKVKTVTDTVWAVQQASALPPARMPLPPVDEIVPELLMPPVKLMMSLAMMAVRPAEMVPLLLMPPEKSEMLAKLTAT